MPAAAASGSAAAIPAGSVIGQARKQSPQRVQASAIASPRARKSPRCPTSFMPPLRLMRAAQNLPQTAPGANIHAAQRNIVVLATARGLLQRDHQQRVDLLAVGDDEAFDEAVGRGGDSDAVEVAAAREDLR